MRFGAAIVRFRWPVLIAYLIAMAVFGVFGIQVFGAMKSEGFNDPASDSSRVAAMLSDDFGARQPAAILAIQTPSGVDTDAASATDLLEQVTATEGVSEVVSYWSTGALRPSAEWTDAPVRPWSSPRTAPTSRSSAPGSPRTSRALKAPSRCTHSVARSSATPSTTPSPGYLARAESIAIPVTALLLLFVFGSVVAAGLPFLVAGGTILGSFLVLFLVSRATDVSVFALNLVTGLGLALGIDYALLIINRFREELRAGRSVPDAVAATVGSAGRTVFRVRDHRRRRPRLATDLPAVLPSLLRLCRYRSEPAGHPRSSHRDPSPPWPSSARESTV
jgi:RND superfamily putative drug exporter